MSGMTDQEAINTIDAYLPRHCRAALDHIAARLRGDGEQGDVIEAECTGCGSKMFAWPQHRYSSKCRGCVADDEQGQAVAEVYTTIRRDSGPKCAIQHVRLLRSVPDGTKLYAALSTQPAPSSPEVE